MERWGLPEKIIYSINLGIKFLWKCATGRMTAKYEVNFSDGHLVSVHKITKEKVNLLGEDKITK